MGTPAQPGLGRWPTRREMPVQWGDMDAFAHVNNTVYMRWFETARIAYFEAVDVARTASDSAPMPILARADIDYRSPVTYPDTVVLESTVLSLGTTSFVMGYRARSQAQGRVVAEGEAVIVLLDPKTGKKTPIPPALRELIVRTEAAAVAP